MNSAIGFLLLFSLLILCSVLYVISADDKSDEDYILILDIEEDDSKHKYDSTHYDKFKRRIARGQIDVE